MTDEPYSPKARITPHPPPAKESRRDSVSNCPTMRDGPAPRALRELSLSAGFASGKKEDGDVHAGQEQQKRNRDEENDEHAMEATYGQLIYVHQVQVEDFAGNWPSVSRAN